MEQFAVIKDIVIILLVSIPIIYLFNRIKIPSIVGFLVSGMLIGPSGLQLIIGIKEIETMAEIGVILLLFFIGLEVSLKELMKMKRFLIIAGGLQISLTVIIFSALFMILQIEIYKSIYIGMLISLSSTAIVLKILSDRNELDAPHGKIALGILIFQDLSIVPMLIFLPILGATSELVVSDIFLKLLASVAAVAVIVMLAKFLMPKILIQIAKLRVREIFTVGILLLLLGTAYLTHSIGLSFAIGAFLAGLILSESDFSHQILSEIIPFKDAFNTLFFVSIGLMLNFNFVIQNPIILTTLTLGIIVLKCLIVIAVVIVMKFPLRIGIITGLTLAQIGEFSFVLSQAGMKYDLIESSFYNAFIASSVFTMVLTPFAIYFAHNLSARIKVKSIFSGKNRVEQKTKISNHVMIAGFGLNGRNLAQVLKETGIPYIVIDLNSETVKKEKAKGENIIYGDTTRAELLLSANIENAKVIVLAISDPPSAKLALRVAKKLNKDIYAVVRTRYIAEVDAFIKLGADVVIPEEFETSLQIFNKVLEKYHIPLNVRSKQVALLRSEGYRVMRKSEEEIHPFIHLDEILALGLTETYYVGEDNIHIGKTLAEINLRSATEATIITIVRNGKIISNPSGKENLQAKDTLVITGIHKAVDDAVSYLDNKKID